MRAAQMTNYGGKEVIQLTEDAPKPTAGSDKVLVEVHAAAVNPFDWKVREGMVRQMKELDLPATLGGDFAGIAAEVPENVTHIKVGDAVYGQADALSGQGSYAEFTPVAAISVVKKPASTHFTTAAALPLTGVSAYQALVEHMDLQAGQKILVHGGAGGIGSFAIQLAKHLGAYVATTVAADDAAYAKELGADETIDYTTQDFSEVLQDYDAVYDTIGGETFTKSHAILKPGGVIVSMVAQPDEALMQQYDVRAISQATQMSIEKLTKLAELVDAGIIKVHIDKIFPLAEAGDAQDYLRDGKHRGKVVLSVREM